MKDIINKVYGPFGFNNLIGVMIVEPDSIVLLKFDLWTSLKYEISQQVPFVFQNAIDNLLKTSIDMLKNKFENNCISYEQIGNIAIKKRGWINSIIITANSNQIKLGIQDRFQTDFYQELIDLINKKKINKY